MSRIRQRWPAVLAVAFSCLLLVVPSGLGQPRAPQTAARAAPAEAQVEPLRVAPDRLLTIRDIRLDLKVDLAKKEVDSQATLQLCSLRPVRTVTLDAVGFEVKEVTLATGQGAPAPARHQHDGEKLIVELGSTWPAGQTGTVQVRYRVHDPKDGLHFFAPTAKQPEAPLQLWSQGESISNRYWFPCFDQPDQRQTTQVVVTVPQGFEALSNGKLLEQKENSDGTVTFDWKQDKPHPAYLVTLVVGQFDIVREDWEGIPVVYYVPKGRKALVGTTFNHTRDMLTFFSRRFGIRYPWDKYAQVAAFEYGGGMENTSATTMGDRILQDERSLLDRSPDWIVAHEMAHQWWGDLVTCRDWSHLWLNEGFASYAEALWAEHSRGAHEYAYNMYEKAAGAISANRRPVMDRHYTSPDAMFDGRSYPKGAWLLHMLRLRLGDDMFWKGIQRYGTEYRLQSAETSDLRRVLERVSGRDLERFFYDWTERAGNPDLEVTTEYLPDSQQARILVKQTQAGEPFHIPLKLVLVCANARKANGHPSSNGKPPAADSGASQPVVLEQEMTEKELSLLVPLTGALERVDVDPDQAVLATIKETKPRSLWQAQLLEAPSMAARIRAVEHFAKSKLNEGRGMRLSGLGVGNSQTPKPQLSDEDRALLARAFAGEKFHGVQLALATALGNAGGETSRDALFQGLQSAEARVRHACVENLGKLGHDAKVAEVLKEILHKGDASAAVEGAALTAYAKQGQKDAVALITPWLSKPSHDEELRAAALTALSATEDPAVLDTLLVWAEAGKPSNCRMAALGGLAQLAKKGKLTDPQRQQLIKPLVAALDNDSRFLRFTVLASLPELGPLASAALPVLDKMSKEETNERMREMVKSAAEKIRGKPKPASSSSADEIGKLREEVKQLREEIQKLRTRLDKEARSASASK
jgi:aminopeptidase N